MTCGEHLMNATRSKVANVHRIMLVLWICILIGFFGARVSKFFFHTDGTFGISAGWDLRGLWDLNHAVLDGVNPYPYALRGECYLPDDYDGKCNANGNTPLFWFITTPIAILDWGTAQIVWFSLNIISSLLILVIIERQFLPFPIQNLRLILLVLLFFASGPVSSIILIGQTSLIIVLFALLGFVLLPKNEFLAGIFLGLALSKYSLTFLLILYLFLDRRYTALLAALLTQVIGLLFLSLFISTPLQVVLSEYFVLVSQFVDSATEFNLHSRIIDLGLGQSLAFALDLVGLAITFATILIFVNFGRKQNPKLVNALILPFLLIGSIPFVYHRHYDAVVLILLTIPYYWDRPGKLQIPSTPWFARHSLSIPIALVLFVLYYPRTVASFSAYPALQTGLLFLDTITMLLIWTVLLVRIWRSVDLPVHLGNASPRVS
jgi:hypothetical protein